MVVLSRVHIFTTMNKYISDKSITTNLDTYKSRYDKRYIMET